MDTHRIHRSIREKLNIFTRIKENILEKKQIFNMNDLDEAILLEILIRLPAKSANRFKCVSKRWKHLISQPYFVRCFIHQNSCVSSPLPFTLIIQYYMGRKQLCITSESQVFKSPGFSLSFLPCYQARDRVPICIVGSYNDLLLCCASSTTTGQNIVYYICNPITMQFVELSPAPQSDEQKFHLKFVCDPITENFGNNGSSIINTTRYAYTIVRIPEFKENRTTKFKLENFSSRTNKWSESYVSLPRACRFSPKASDSVVYNQIMYWLCQPHGVLAVDVFGINGGRACNIIGLPSNFKGDTGNCCIGVSQGRLRLSQLLAYAYEHCHLSLLSVWELKDYNAGKWCLEHKVFLSEIASETSELFEASGKLKHGCNLGFNPDDADIIYLFIDNWVVSYNMSCKTLKLASSRMHGKGYFFMDDVFSLKLPCWPTPIPIILL